ncbi:hypothetical protein [Colwellia sp. MB02u-14]|uniref:hypothetical protein n=1 Tax=Colwellia sp. MB02u-14 TaxID=2759815 RepID=UPI0015F69E83|nr:hypothetical protein [Colwellia sp. MB02u-14]MBA6302331.1 hypothetical protein [Colwellia sp. MB02u-14]
MMLEDAYSLTIVAGSNSDEQTYNPYSKNGLFISPNIALWVLQTFDYPYSNCGEKYKVVGICDMPFILWVGRALGRNGGNSDKRLFSVLDEVVSRGLPINQSYEGFTAVHEAILFNNAVYLEYLLKNGGDTTVKTQRPNSELDKLNSYQFLEILKLKNKSGMVAVEEVLNRYREMPNKPFKQDF